MAVAVAGVMSAATGLVMVWAGEPTEIVVWNLLPYGLFALLGARCRTKFAWLLSGLYLAVGAGGALALADGLLFQWGILVDPDPQVSHLISLLLPIHLTIWALVGLVVVWLVWRGLLVRGGQSA